jgi:hypothetical protein
MKYRGIENVYGSVWKFVDGVNINNAQAWVCQDANDYASNVFAAPYLQLGYTDGTTSGYISGMGWDGTKQYAAFPVSVVGGAVDKYYCDYYSYGAGQIIALLGGNWLNGAYDGVSYWYLSLTSSYADVTVGGRLLKKAL